MDLPMPPMYSGWDPLLQRVVERSGSLLAPATPASSAPPTRIGGAHAMQQQHHQQLDSPSSATLMPPPPPRLPQAGMGSGVPAMALPGGAAAATAAGGAAGTGELSAVEMEEASIALAYQLQMEEQMGLPHRAGVQQMETGDGEEDESLQLAIRLQQEELQWHGTAGHGGVAAAGEEEELDEDMRLAMQLSQQQGD